jgi:hypothetical protein
VVGAEDNDDDDDDDEADDALEREMAMGEDISTVSWG